MNYIINNIKIRFNFKMIFKKIFSLYLVYIYIYIYFYNIVLIYMLLFNKKHRISYNMYKYNN